MRAVACGSDGLAEICTDDAENIIIPLIPDDLRDEMNGYVERLQRGGMTINAYVKQLIKNKEIGYNDPGKRPSHIDLV